ncbi:methyltransferase domain-containing protein [bacterium]|nr:methyltransferase domain-containing protein [bacterium]
MAKAAVVIRAKNEARMIGETLKRVFAQHFDDFEVIVVDSGSTDGTLDLVRATDAKLVEIKPEDFTYGRALNVGVAATNAPIVAFISAHAWPMDKDWLANLVAPFADDQVAAVTGKPLPHLDCNPFDRRGLLRRYGTDMLYLHVGSSITYSNADAAIRRSDWEAEPFDETLTYSEDIAWANARLAAGRRIVYQPYAAAYHSHNETAAELYRRFDAEARARVAIGQGTERYRISRLLWDTFAGAAYDKWTVIKNREGWRWLKFAPVRRIAINLGRYTGSRNMPKDNEYNPIARIGLRAGIAVLQKFNYNLQRLAPYVVRATRKHNKPIHPKHLLKNNEAHYWYGPYIQGAKRVLDLGCNQGMHAVYAARHAEEVVGIDMDLQHLYVANFNARWEGHKNVTCMVYSAEKPLPFADGSFDVVIAFDIIEHLVERDLFLKEIHRVLTPEGTLLLSAPNSETTFKKLKRAAGLWDYSDPTHVIEYTRAELEDECKRGGFTCTHIEPVVLDTPFFGFIDFLGGFSLPLYERFDRYKREAVIDKPLESSGYRLVLKREAATG